MALFEKAAAASSLRYIVIDLANTDNRAISVRSRSKRLGEIFFTSTSCVRCHEKKEPDSKATQGIFHDTGNCIHLVCCVKLVHCIYLLPDGILSPEIGSGHPL